MNFKKYFWDLCLVFLLGVILYAPLKIYNSNKIYGWDSQIYCKAIEVSKAGLDPYVTENLGMKLSYTYPGLFLKIYEPICQTGPRGYLFFHLLALLVIAGLLIIKLKWDPGLVLPWLFLGYNAAYGNYTTGNIGVFEALFFTFFLVTFVNENKGGILWLVPSAFIKIVPSVMALPAVLVSGRTWVNRLMQLLSVGLGVFFLEVLNYIYSENLFFGFIKQITGGYGSQHSPIKEVESNPSNPTVLFFLKNFSEKIFANQWIFIFSILVLGLFYFSYWVWKNTIRDEKNKLLQLCWSYLILFLWVPRLKPYSFIIICIVMMPILQKMGRKISMGLLLVSIFHRSLNGERPNTWLDFLANNTMVYVYIGILAFLTFKSVNIKKQQELPI